MIILYIYDEDLQKIKWFQHILEKYIIIEAFNIKMIQLAQQIRQADALGKIIFSIISNKLAIS